MDWNPVKNRLHSANESFGLRDFFACIITVMQDDAFMPAPAPQRVPEKNAPRITVTLPPEHYHQIVQRAKGKRVSASWIVRDAVEKYLASDIPVYENNDKRTAS